MNEWWTASDAAKFAELNARRAENVSTHEVLPGMKANGVQTVTEDVADLGGFNIAYDLWVNKLKDRGLEGEALNDMKRQFFIDFAVQYSEKLPVADMVERAKVDRHSAGHIRINSVVQHIDDWYELFDVTEGDALYLAPEQRITIW
jgi:putative endopeptidase